MENRQIKTLPLGDLELLSFLIVDDLSRAEISRKLNVSRAAVTKRITRIKKILEGISYNVNKQDFSLTTK